MDGSKVHKAIEAFYDEVLDYMLRAGARLREKAGQIKDIGIKKQYLTEEDLEIERTLKSMIKTFDNSHEVFAEEENDIFPNAKNIWVIDPISGTNTFI